MTCLVLDKNHDLNSDSNIDEIKNLLDQNTLNSIMYSDPFSKIFFLTKILSRIKIPTIYLDFDLLYSGYITSDIVKLPNNVSLSQPIRKDWNSIIKNILLKITKTKSLIIIDSLNGFFNLFEENKDVGRLINSYIMLLVCIAKMSNSLIALTAMVRNTEKEQVLSLTGRRILETKNMTKISLNKTKYRIQVGVINDNSSQKSVYSFPLAT